MPLSFEAASYEVTQYRDDTVNLPEPGTLAYYDAIFTPEPVEVFEVLTGPVEMPNERLS